MNRATPTQTDRHSSRRARATAMCLAIVAMLGHCRRLVAGEEGTGAPHKPDRLFEAKVKVAYIYNFPKFVEWPGDKRRTGPEPLRICVLGADAVGAMLDELASRKVGDRPIEVSHLEGESIPDSCHLLYVSRSEQPQARLLQHRLQGMPILTVSDAPGFARAGGMIGFAVEAGRVKIEINQQFVRQAGLRVRAKLLEVARIVR